MINSLLPTFSDLVDAAGQRWPLKVSIYANGVDPCHIALSITNWTKEIPLSVNSVRIHYGAEEYSHFFSLWHIGIKSEAEELIPVSVAPKNTESFYLSYDNMCISRRHTSMNWPRSKTDSMPNFDSPENLFNAIGIGEPSHSWVEVDFNEFTNKKFLVGKVKAIFDGVGRYTRESRKQSR